MLWLGDQMQALTSASRSVSLAILLPDPGDDFPNGILGRDGLTIGGIGPTTFSEPLRTKPCFSNAFPGLRLPVPSVIRRNRVSSSLPHDRDLVSRRDIVSRRKVRARNSCRTKQRAIGIARDGIVVSTAHGPADKHSLPVCKPLSRCLQPTRCGFTPLRLVRSAPLATHPDLHRLGGTHLCEGYSGLLRSWS
jgi:hypothetical protein